jgi:thioesterase domain-containing protein/NAD(P)-dependent dehydrogenase (short-subunit alcohol dehydrogenase family)/acyl carrier protein
MPREMPGITCSSLDIELPGAAKGGWLARLRGAETAPAPSQLTDRLLEDLMAPPANIRAAWRGDRRLVQGWRPVDLAGNPELPVFRHGGTYLITGGFGGIGLTVAADLMRREGANVVLLSRGKLPPENAWKRYLRTHGPTDPVARRIRALQDLQAIGQGAVIALAGDVANIGQMRAAVAEAETRFGPLSGVIHAAGEIDDAPLLAKTEADMLRVFTPKAAGLRVLDALFPDGTLDLMVLFSSTSTATRPAGQVDYIAANEYLDAFARSRRGGATRVCAIDWGVWAGVGMAAQAMAARQGDDGPTAMEPAGQPLLDQAGWDAEGNRLFRTDLTATDRWVLDEHRLADGTAVMPGTGYIEIAAEALHVQGVEGPFEIRNLDFLRVLRAPDTGTARMVTRLSPTARGYAFSVHSGEGSADGYVLNAQADIVLPNHRPAHTPIDLRAIAARCPRVDKAGRGDRLKSPQEAHLRFGPRWHVLRETALGKAEGLAVLTLPPDHAAETRKGVRLHPGLLDLATGWAMALVPSYDNSQLWVPLSYHALRVLAPLPAEIRSWVRLERGFDAADGFAGFDVIITDSTGRICVEVEGFRMKRLDGALDLSAGGRADASAADLGLVARGADTRLSPDERRLHHNIAQGIRPDEGPEALRRALALGLPQVVISSLNLPALIAQADHVAAPASEPGHSFERPDLDTDYVAPETGLEHQLAGWFESLLGVSRVGTRDSFFDLGGHSLIAVRLFAQIRRALDVDFPISVLFEAPDVASLAALIGERAGSADTPATADAPEQPPAQPRQHLVALQKSPGAERTPLFIVAGMFGNVLNLRHLALTLGRDRPVWGLQARGLIGDAEPHRDMVEAAADYIAEMRQIQPHGPYLLAGFSGGGIAAYEMAQQLQAAGEEVALLAMLDTPLPVRPYPSRRDRALIKLAEFRRKGIRYLVEWGMTRLRWEIARRRAAPATPGEAPEFNNQQIEAAFRQAVGSYVLKPWDGPLVLFRPPLDRHWKVSGGAWISAAKEYVLDDNGWTDFAPATRVIEVPGDHDSMVLVPNVSVLAEEMKRCIAATETNAGDDEKSGWPVVAAAE